MFFQSLLKQPWCPEQMLHLHLHTCQQRHHLLHRSMSHAPYIRMDSALAASAGMSHSLLHPLNCCATGVQVHMLVRCGTVNASEIFKGITYWDTTGHDIHPFGEDAACYFLAMSHTTRGLQQLHHILFNSLICEASTPKLLSSANAEVTSLGKVVEARFCMYEVTSSMKHGNHSTDCVKM